ncbi:MAG: hypothetical protein KAJ43_03740, partial [Gemmatimonadetes bacterium]|nr:hypothetical protein [Gemmatimonadota bacterium]
PVEGVRMVPPVCVAPDVVLEDTVIGPNVSIGSGSTIRGGRLRDSIVGENSVLEGCDVHDSLIGDHVTARGLTGTASVGDDTVIDALD